MKIEIKNNISADLYLENWIALICENISYTTFWVFPQKQTKTFFLTWYKLVQIKQQLAVLTHTVQMSLSNQLSSSENVYHSAFSLTHAVAPQKMLRSTCHFPIKINIEPLLLYNFSFTLPVIHFHIFTDIND